MANAYWEPLAFTIQSGPADRWARVIDTGRDSPDDSCEAGAEIHVTSPTYLVQPRSVVALLER